MTATAILAPVQTKTCTKCGEVKSINEFGLVSASKDGRHCYCKQCKRAVQSNVKTDAMVQHIIAKELKSSAEFVSCKCCGQKKRRDTENFYSGSRGKLFSKCKPCVSKETKERKLKDDPDLPSRRMVLKAEFDRISLLKVKVCTVCGEEKPATNEFFYSQKLGVFGLRAICKCCAAEKQREKRFNADAAQAKADAASLLALGLKRCVKCETDKPIEQFNNISRSIDGKDGYCKDCRSIMNKDYRDNNGDILKIKASEFRSKNAELIRARSKKYKEENPETVKLANKASWIKNRHKYRDTIKQYRDTNKVELQAKKLAYRKNRVVVDVIYAMRVRVSGLIAASIRNSGWTKKSRTHEILGCSYKEFVTHIEKQFTKGMTWENRSEWQIDHITPLATAKTEAEVIALNHFTNLRPLWAKDNLAKSDSIQYLI